MKGQGFQAQLCSKSFSNSCLHYKNGIVFRENDANSEIYKP